MQKSGMAEFAEEMNRIIPVMLREFARRQISELYKGKITMPQSLLLEQLFREGEAKMSVLAKSMGVTTAAMTGIIERIVRDGYVVRAYDPGDRRVVKIKLTPKGRDLAKGIHDNRHRMLINIFSKISSKDRADYLRIISHVRDILVKKGA